MKDERTPGPWSRSSFLLTGAAAVAATQTPAHAAGGFTAFVGMRLIDGRGGQPVDNAVLIAGRGSITAQGPRASVTIPAGARVVDLTGKTVMPALIDAHSHVGIIAGNTISTDHYTPERINGQLRTFAAYGVRAVQVLGTDQDSIFAIKASQGERPVAQARVYSAYRGFGVQNGQPPMSLGKFVFRPASVSEAREQFGQFIAKRPDVVKLWVDDTFHRQPRMSQEIARALIADAHSHGLRVAAHVFFLDDAKWLVDAGLDMIGHSVRDREIDAELLAMMKAHGTMYIPTLTIDEARYVFADRPAYMNDPFFVRAVPPDTLAWLRTDGYRDAILAMPDTALWRAAAAMSKRNAAIVHAAGIPVAMGTDSGGAPERIIGYDSHKELELLVAQGFTPLEAIRAATVTSAAAIGKKAYDLGSLAPGKRADFVVLDADPSVNIANTRRIASVWYGGEKGPDWQTVAHHAHDRDVAMISTADYFDPAKSHLRAGCC